MTQQTTPEAPPSLEELYQEHAKRVYRVAFRVTGSASDAEDVLQTVFLRLLKREDAVVLGATAGSYLHRAAVNAGLDLLRSRRRAKAVPIDDEGDDRALRTDVQTEPEARARRAEVRDVVRDALTSLNPKSAEIFTLRYLEGFGNTEIAEMLETTRSAVGVTLHRSRARLRDELGGVLSVADA